MYTQVNLFKQKIFVPFIGLDLAILRYIGFLHCFLEQPQLLLDLCLHHEV